MTEPTLREHIETKLVISGFAVDTALQGAGILAWPRGMDINEANFVITEQKGEFVVLNGTGKFASKKLQKYMNHYLKQWGDEYRMGAR